MDIQHRHKLVDDYAITSALRKGKVRPLPSTLKGIGGYAAFFDPEITVPADLEYPARDPQGLLVARMILDNRGRGEVVGIVSIR